MSVLEFLASVIHSIAWPAVVAFGIWVLRTPIGGFIKRMKTFSAGKDGVTASTEIAAPAGLNEALEKTEEPVTSRELAAAARKAAYGGDRFRPPMETRGGGSDYVTRTQSFDGGAMPADLAESAETAIKRQRVTELMQHAFRFGYETREVWPSSSTPHLVVRWGDDGSPQIFARYSAPSDEG